MIETKGEKANITIEKRVVFTMEALDEIFELSGPAVDGGVLGQTAERLADLPTFTAWEERHGYCTGLRGREGVWRWGETRTVRRGRMSSVHGSEPAKKNLSTFSVNCHVFTTSSDLRLPLAAIPCSISACQTHTASVLR
jgi:hypothetical protein